MNQEARDDEREALERLLSDLPDPSSRADAILAAGYRKRPEPEITDEMVERAAVAVGSADLPHWTWEQNLQSGVANDYRKMARAALVAALQAVEEGEQ